MVNLLILKNQKIQKTNYNKPHKKPEPRKIIEVKLSDNRSKKIKFNIETKYYDKNGNIISAVEYLKSFFGELTKLFKKEE